MPLSFNSASFQPPLPLRRLSPATARQNPFHANSNQAFPNLRSSKASVSNQTQFGVDTTLFSQAEIERMAKLRDRITLSDSDYYRLQDTLDHDRFDLRTLYRDPYEYYWLVELDFDPNRNKTPTSADEYQQVDDFASDSRS